MGKDTAEVWGSRVSYCFGKLPNPVITTGHVFSPDHLFSLLSTLFSLITLAFSLTSTYTPSHHEASLSRLRFHYLLGYHLCPGLYQWSRWLRCMSTAAKISLSLSMHLSNHPS